MNKISKFLVAVVIGFIMYQPICVKAQNTKERWTDLFDGKTLQGWKPLSGEEVYTVENGVIVGAMTKGMPSSFLVTEQEYGDFILELEVKLEGNRISSGIQIRSQYDSDVNKAKNEVYGKQVKIDPTKRSWTGGIYDEARRGWLYTMDLNEKAKSAYKENEFNHIRIEAIGEELRTWVNGIPVSYVIDTIDRRGLVGLQVNNISEDLDGEKVYFKNIRIQTKELKPKPFPTDVFIVNLKPNDLSLAEKKAGFFLLFDGKTAKKWRSVYSDAFPDKGWKVENGEITVLKSDGGESTNGGDIITRDQYAVFDLSFEFKMTPGANSGVKYFVTLKEKTKGSAIGLEYQILDDKLHPDAKRGRDGNRTLASLYDLITSDREAHARRPIGEWNRGRIVVANDNTVTHYLNGIKVLEYKRGSKEYQDLVAISKYKNWDNFGEASQGHILLQDHGDHVSFRNIKIKKTK